MVKTGLLLRIEARPGKEAEVERLLTGSLSRARKEASMRAWFALRLGPSTFGVFEAFTDETARNAHLAGEFGQSLTGLSPDLCELPPQFEKVEILASKLPSG